MKRIEELRVNAATNAGLTIQLYQYFQEKYPNEDMVIGITDGTAFVEIAIGDNHHRFEYTIETVKDTLQPFMST